MAEKVALLWGYKPEDLAAPGAPTGTSYVLRVYTASSGAGGSGSEDLELGELVAGRFYWVSGDDQSDAATFGGPGDLVKLLETALNTNTHLVTFSVGREVGGRIVFTVTGGTAKLEWSHANTTLRAEAFGFAQNADSPGTASSTFSSPNVAGGQFLPGKALRSRVPDELTVGGISASGSAWRSAEHGAEIDTLDIAFGLIARERGPVAYAASTEPLNTLGHLWRALKRGRPVRLYLDVTSFDASSYTLWRLDEASQDLKPVRPDGRDRLKWQLLPVGLVEVTA